MSVRKERWPLSRPFRITGHTFLDIEVVVVEVEKDGRRGCGEASGVYYLNDDAEHMCRQLEGVRQDVEAGLGRLELQSRLPRGGARNALDCALWDLEAAIAGKPAWALIGMKEPRPLITTFTVGAGEPDDMAAAALAFSEARAIKLKLVGDGEDAERVRAVRRARPDVWLGVDANQGWDRRSFEDLAPHMEACGVKLIEQPFKRGCEAEFDGIACNIELAADESVLDRADIAPMVGRVQVINIKLDKCGGLTEGLAMIAECQRLGFKVMVGNMMGTSLSVGPGFLLGQYCDIVDLDSPLVLENDRPPAVSYAGGQVMCPAAAWGDGMGHGRNAGH